MTEFYFVRHGESTANVAGVAAGWSDVPLTEKGWRQVEEVASHIKAVALSFDMIFTSPSSRALDTAKVIATRNGFSEGEIITLPELREKSAGSLELRPLHEMFSKTEEQLKALGGESAEMFQERVEKALQTIRERSKGRATVLVVAHSGTYKMAEVIMNGLAPATQMYDVEIPKSADLLKILL